jgi:hypothetical protein
MRKELIFFFCVGGIYFFYLLFGIEQEKITKSKWGANQEKFTETMFLIGVQCLVNALVALVGALILRYPADKTPNTEYSLVAFTYMSAMVASNAALQCRLPNSSVSEVV